MAFRTKATVFFLLAVLVLECRLAGSDLFSPLFDTICKGVSCGKGTCKRSNSSFSFECQCDAGWKQPFSDWNIFPCIIPNCSLDSSCGVAAAPAPDTPNPSSILSFNPCSWNPCGGGTCNKQSTYSYSCSCATGYQNLLNESSFPCVRNCSFGADCLNLGLSLGNSSSPPSQSQTATPGVQSSHHSKIITSPLSTSFIMLLLILELFRG